MRFHRITVLSREDDKRMSELSNGVAMEVTQFSCLRVKVNNRTSVTSSVRAYRTEDGGDDENER